MDVHSHPFCQKHTLDLTKQPYGTFTLVAPATLPECQSCKVDRLEAVNVKLRNALEVARAELGAGYPPHVVMRMIKRELEEATLSESAGKTDG